MTARGSGRHRRASIRFPPPISGPAISARISPTRASTIRKTGNPDGTGRTPFAGNKIPTNRLDPITLKLQSLLPAAERSRRGAR